MYIDTMMTFIISLVISCSHYTKYHDIGAKWALHMVDSPYIAQYIAIFLGAVAVDTWINIVRSTKPNLFVTLNILKFVIE